MILNVEKAPSTYHLVPDKGWASLPENVLGQIFKQLYPYESAPFSLVCKAWRQGHTTWIRNSLVHTLELTVTAHVSDLFVMLLVRPVEIPIETHLYCHEKRGQIPATQQQEELVELADRCRKRLKEGENVTTELQDIKARLAALVCTLPTFMELRQAESIPDIRNAFIKSVDALIAASKNNLKFKGVVEMLQNHLFFDGIINHCQAYVVPDILPFFFKYCQVKQKYPWDPRNPCHVRFASSRIPNLLEFFVSGQLLQYPMVATVVAAARELVTRTEFVGSNCSDLLVKYHINWSDARWTIIEELVKAQRFTELEKVLTDPILGFREEFKDRFLSIISSVIAHNNSRLTRQLIMSLYNGENLIRQERRTGKYSYGPFSSVLQSTIDVLLKRQKNQEAIELLSIPELAIFFVYNAQDWEDRDNWPLDCLFCISIFRWLDEIRQPIPEPLLIEARRALALPQSVTDSKVLIAKVQERKRMYTRLNVSYEFAKVYAQWNARLKLC